MLFQKFNNALSADFFIFLLFFCVLGLSFLYSHDSGCHQSVLLFLFIDFWVIKLTILTFISTCCFCFCCCCCCLFGVLLLLYKQRFQDRCFKSLLYWSVNITLECILIHHRIPCWSIKTIKRLCLDLCKTILISSKLIPYTSAFKEIPR